MDEGSQTIKTEGSFGDQTFNLELDHYKNSTQRSYPSVSDYYEASKGEEDIPLQLQPGLSNYSGLKLGDDRINFGESILSATYRIPVEHLMSIDAPSKGQTKHSRKREYQAAISKVGETELNRLERVMKDKLFQRSYATSSPFQVRKAFKFFDRDATLRIPIEGFTRALEFLGFQFAELQNLALFARYDEEYSGEIDYMNFISTAMFYAAVEPDFGQVSNALVEDVLNIGVSSKVDEEKARRLQLASVKKVFNKVDKSGSGSLDKNDFELFMMALSFNLTTNELDACLQDMGVQSGISLELFFEWWTDPAGPTLSVFRK